MDSRKINELLDEYSDDDEDTEGSERSDEDSDFEPSDIDAVEEGEGSGGGDDTLEENAVNDGGELLKNYSDHDLNRNDNATTEGEDNSEKESAIPPEDRSETTALENLKLGREKLPEWEGKRLFPPPNARKGKDSAWIHGGFLRDTSGQLITSHFICGHYGHRGKYHKTPQNLKTHLATCKVYSKVDQKKKNKNPTPAVSEFFSSVKIVKYSETNTKQQRFRSKTVDWVVNNMRPLNILHDKDLIEAIEIADPKLNLISRNTATADINKKYQKVENDLIEEFRKIDYFAATTDGGSARDNRSFTALIVHYIGMKEEKLVLKKKLLRMVEMRKGKTAKQYRAEVDEVLNNFGIKEKTNFFTTDNESTMQSAFTETERNGCWPHILSISTKKAMKAQKELTDIRGKMRKISSLAHKSPKFMIEIQKGQEEQNLPLTKLQQEEPTRFTATFTMMKSFLNVKLENIDDDMEIIYANIQVINNALINVGIKKTKLENLTLKRSEISKVVQLMKVLETLEECITVVGSEKKITASLMHKCVKNLYEFLKPNDTDPVFLHVFKEKVKAEIKERNNKNLNTEVLAKAAIFDKRNNLDSLFNPQYKDQYLDELRQELEAIEKSEKDNNNETIEAPVVKRRRIIEDSDDDEKSDIQGTSVKSKASVELERFQLEPKLKSSDDPLLWLTVKRLEYPLMSKLAMKYLPVQASSTPAERAMSRMNNILSQKRTRMKSDLFNKMMVLSDMSE